jgi:rRNA pseudouridine-1189 N-methylase Emg1 (Nep1/Mra1 family)
VGEKMSSSADEVLKTAEEILAEVRKINDLLKDSEIEKTADRLYLYTTALKNLIERNLTVFRFKLQRSGDIIYVEVYHEYDPEQDILVFTVNGSTAMDQVLEKLFSTERHETALLRMIVNRIIELSKALSERANIVERVRELERKLQDP